MEIHSNSPKLYYGFKVYNENNFQLINPTEKVSPPPPPNQNGVTF